MKKNLLWRFSVIFFILFVFISLTQRAFAISESECFDVNNLKSHTDECLPILEKLKNEASQKATSLKTELLRIDASIAITTARIIAAVKEIENLEKEIASLNSKIGQLDISLDQISEILAKRIAETYKRGQIDFVSLFLSSQNFSDFVSRYKYLKVVQLHDRSLMVQMETARTNFEDQKTLKEQKQTELETAKKRNESLKVILAQQKNEKDLLLKETQNSEKRFQELINQALAEKLAIEGILAGRGKELEIGNVSENQRIASIIEGRSCNSSGTHLHFAVKQDDKIQNPFNYLKGGISYENCSGPGPGCNSADTFNPSGTWNWPLNEPIIFNQGFGKTWAVEHYVWLRNIYNSHDGIDITSSSLEVKSVKSGKLYRGSFSGQNSCVLRYVRVHHDEGNLDTYYLHVNY